MQRFSMSKLVEWKHSSRRKPLLLLGARQVGKTWLMNEFGKSHYERVAYIRFDKNNTMRAVFEQDYDLKRILLAIQVSVGFAIDPGSTLLIFDEIQTCPAALTALKYFCEEAREYHIIAAGSLLGVSAQHGTGFPVGKVDRMYLYPMTFTEFLLASGHNQLLQLLQNRDWPMVKVFQDKFIELLRYYYFVGGMPEVVDTFISTSDLTQVRELQMTLLSDFLADFGKHSPAELRPKIGKIWDSIPAQLAKENKKFVYSSIQSGMSSRELEPALRWLLDAGLALSVERVAKPAIPMSSYCDSAFKLFFVDVGLLAAKANLSAKAIIEGSRIFQEFKGALTEQYVLQQLVAETGLKPYYWSAKNGNSEIDFLVETDDQVIPIEAKAEQNLQAKSLKVFCKKFQSLTAIRTSMHHYFTQSVPHAVGDEASSNSSYTLIDLPLYGISQIQREIQDSSSARIHGVPGV